MVEVYQSVAKTHVSQGGIEREECVLTAEICRELDICFFCASWLAAFLHQMPIYGQSQRPDFLATTMQNGVADVSAAAPSSDFKPCDIGLSIIESLAYCSRLLGSDFRVLLNLPATCTTLKLQLITSFSSTTICNADVVNSTHMMNFFYTLYGAVHYLLQYPIAYEVPCFSPIPGIVVNHLNLLSLSTEMYRTFLHNNSVYKLYDMNGNLNLMLKFSQVWAILRMLNYMIYVKVVNSSSI